MLFDFALAAALGSLDRLLVLGGLRTVGLPTGSSKSGFFNFDLALGLFCGMSSGFKPLDDAPPVSSISFSIYVGFEFSTLPTFLIIVPSSVCAMLR